MTCVLCSLQWTQSAGVRTILDWFWRAAAPTEPFLCWRSPATSSGTWRRLTTLTRWFTENTFVDVIQCEVWLTFSLHFSIVLCRLAATLSAGLRPCFREVWSTSPRPRNRTTSNALFLEAATTWSNCGSEFALCFFFLSFFFFFLHFPSCSSFYFIFFSSASFFFSFCTFNLYGVLSSCDQRGRRPVEGGPEVGGSQWLGERCRLGAIYWSSNQHHRQLLPGQILSVPLNVGCFM